MVDAEPVLSDDDREAWERWQEVCAVHAQTKSFKRRVDSAVRAVDIALSRAPNTMVSWSGGKDSTVMAHLVRVTAGIRLRVVSEKDDLDFPGEEEYVTRMAGEWDMDLEIVRPPVSPWEWFVANARGMAVGDDIHGRSSGMSKACFYNVMQSANESYDGVMMGLRSEESHARARLRKARGRVYELRDGRVHSIPLADWSGLDVMSYAQLHGIELLPVYRCIGLMHADAPWTLRKSWWLPGASAWFGQIAWLRRYYPSLHRRLLAVMPQSRMF